AAPSRPGEGGNLVALEAGLGEPCTAGDGDVGRLVLVRNSRRRAYREQRVRFQGELVVAEVCRLEHERLLDVRERALHRLPGEREHQIEVEVGDAGRVQFLGSRDRGAPVVDPAEGLQLYLIEALHAQRDAVDARGAVVAEAAMLD